MIMTLIKFITDVFILLYLTVESIFIALIPKRLLYKELKDEIVLITGAGSGLGRMLAIKLSVLGLRVVVWDVNATTGQYTVKLITKLGGKGYFYLCDVSKKEDVYATAIKVKEEVGSVSILINNAAVTNGKLLLDLSDQMIEKAFGVNVLAHFWTCRAFLPDMIANNHGHIVNVASLAGFSGIYKLSHYCSTKSAVIGFHESLYAELKKYECDGIKLTLVCTWHMNTDMFKGIKVRFLPPLEVSDVAERVISAIRSNEDVVIYPWYYKLGLILKSIFPLSSVTKFLEMGGTVTGMDNFIEMNKE